ncbi:hypothetical protein [Pseudomonas sp.]|uniref:hypothetical protein n=1 Tax=Pseudomonas sp. TaxID=306 RepID=UPI003F2F71E2
MTYFRYNLAFIFMAGLLAGPAYSDELPASPAPSSPTGVPVPAAPPGATWIPSNPKAAEDYRKQAEKDRESLEVERAAQPSKNLDGYLQGIGKYKQNIQNYRDANGGFQRQQMNVRGAQ